MTFSLADRGKLRPPRIVVLGHIASHRDLTLFNLAIDSKLRGCDLAKLKAAGVLAAASVKECASIIQSKTRKPVRFEITEGTRKSLFRWIV